MQDNNKKVVLIDNYDSFTYNLVHIINELIVGEVTVLKNDQFQLKDLEAYDYIILSPGPGVPDEAGLLKDVIKTYRGSKKIFGVCLGLQAIGEVYGAELRNLDQVYHGRKTEIFTTAIEDQTFAGIDKIFDAGRYHSWVIDKATMPSELLITAIDKNGEIMAARHTSDHVSGVQFHPESIMTPTGKQMLANFLEISI